MIGVGAAVGSRGEIGFVVMEIGFGSRGGSRGEAVFDIDFRDLSKLVHPDICIYSEKRRNFHVY